MRMGLEELTIAGVTTQTGISVTGDSLTTGQLGSFYSNGTDANARNLVQIINDNVAANHATCLYVQQDGQGNAAATGLTITGVLKEGCGINVALDSLTTGNLAYFYSNSASTESRFLVSIVNDHVDGVGATCLRIQQDAFIAGFNNYSIDIAHNANSAAINIITTCTTNPGIYVRGNSLTTGDLLHLESAAANASTRNLAYIHNSNAAATNTTCLYLMSMYGKALNVSHYDSINYAVEITGGSGSGTSILLQIDTSEVTTGMLAHFYSNSTHTDVHDVVRITNNQSAAVGSTCLSIYQHANNYALFVTSANNGIWYEGSGLTTGNGLLIQGDVLMTGNLMYITSASANASARNLVTIVNSNAAALGAYCLYIDQNAPTYGLYIDHDGGGASIAVRIDTSAVTGGALYVHDANSLTTGYLCNFASGSPDASYRGLVLITNANSGAVGTVCLDIVQNADYRALQIYNAGTATQAIFAITGANALTTGNMALFISNAASASARNLVQIDNLNPAADGAIGLMISQAGDSPALYIDYNATVSDTITGLRIDGCDVAPGSNNVSITNIAPAGVGTATISRWLVVNIGGANYYIPMWT